MRTVVRKKKSNFQRHHSDRYKRLKDSWRKPKGIDSVIRRKFRGERSMPNIGYGTEKKNRGKTKGRFYKISVSNLQDMRKMSMLNNKFEVEIKKGVGKKKRMSLLDIASRLDLRISNFYNKSQI